MNTPHENGPDNSLDPIDQLLSEAHEQEHVDDAGFTARVTAKLPRTRRTPWRSYVHFIASLFGIVLAIWFVQTQWSSIGALFSEGIAGLSTPASQEALMALAALIIATGALLYSLYTAVTSEE